MLARRPMLCFALSLMAGVVLQRWYPGTWAAFPWLAALLCFAGIYVLLTPRRTDKSASVLIPEAYRPLILATPGYFARRGLNRVVLLACLACFIIGGARQRSWHEAVSSSRLPDADWFQADFITRAPSHDYPGATGPWRVPALLTSVDGTPVDPILVRLSGSDKERFRRGDTISARVRRNTIAPPSYPHAFDYALWLERDGMIGSLSIPTARNVGYRVTPVEDVSLYIKLRRGLDHVRAVAITATLEHGGEHGGMLAAMLYGYRKDVPEEVRDAFRRVGIGHVLAISGLHVGLIAGLLWWLSGWVGWPSRYRALACLVLVLIYLGLSGAMVAAVRATIMACIHLSAIAWGRRSDMLNSLGAAAFLLVLLNPSSPLDVSFQLSFTAVVFIFIALRQLPYRDRPRRRRPSGVWKRRLWRLRRQASSLARLSLSTWLGLFPIIALVFNQINLAGLIINIVVIPLMSLVLSGGLLLPWLAQIPGLDWLLLSPSEAVTELALWVDTLPWSSFGCHAPSTLWVVLFYTVFFAFAMTGVIRDRRLRRWAGMTTGAVLALTFAGVLVSSLISSPPPPGGRIAVLPGWSSETVMAESEEGGIAVIGAVPRGGIEQAGWLHYLRRGGPVSVMATGPATIDDMATLAYHYPLEILSAIPGKDADAAASWPQWQTVPGAAGIEYAISRDRKGTLAWIAVRVGEKTVTLSPRIAVRQLTWRLEHETPGFDADLFSLGFKERKIDAAELPVPPKWAALREAGAEYPFPDRWFRRDAFGALVLEGKTVLSGYDGKEWVSIQ